MKELSVGFSALSPRGLGNLAKTIHGKLTEEPGNVYFTTPVPTMTDLKAAITQHEEALNGEDTSTNIAKRVSTREVLTGLLEKLAANVELTADGDLVKLAATGFNFKKARVISEGLVAAPQNLRVMTTGIAGETLAKVAAVALASGYEAHYTLDPINGPWTPIPVCTSSQNILFTGLQRGKDYYFRVRAIGAKGPSGWSDVATMMVV